MGNPEEEAMTNLKGSRKNKIAKGSRRRGKKGKKVSRERRVKTPRKESRKRLKEKSLVGGRNRKR